MNTKKTLAAALAVALVLALALVLETSAQDAKPTVLRLGTLAPEGTPWADLLERVKEKVESASKGSIKVKLYLNGRQGDEPAMLKKVGERGLEGGGFTSSGIAGLVPEIAVLELPFLFDDDAEADHVMDRAIRDDMARRFEAKGLYLYAWAVNGWVDLGSTKGPLVAPADFKAAKPYSRESRARSAFWTALGASPAAVPVPEVAGALAAGKIDAYDTTPLFAAAAQWHGATKHWTDSNHVYQPAALVLDLAFWKALPDDVRRALEAYSPELTVSARKAVRGLDQGILDGFRAQGMQLHPLAAAEREALKKATAGVGAALAGEGVFPKELHDKVVQATQAFRAEHAKKADPVADAIAAADKYAAARPNVGELNRGEYELQEALRRDPKSYEAMWRMARMKFYLGRYGAESGKIAKYESGMEWAKKAEALDPKRVEGPYWLGCLIGVFGEAKGITSSLFLVDDMEEALKRAEAIDATFDGGGPQRVLGRLFFKLPWAAGGSNDKALKYLRSAIKSAPTMPYTAVYLGEVLIDEDEEKEAKELLNKLLAAPAPPAWVQEHEECKAEARKLLKKLD